MRGPATAALVVVVQLWFLRAAVAAPRCTPGTATFVLLSASPPRCLSSGVAVLWPRVRVRLGADCGFAIAGAGNATHRFPTSGALVEFPYATNATGSGGTKSGGPNGGSVKLGVCEWQTWGFEGGPDSSLPLDFTSAGGGGGSSSSSGSSSGDGSDGGSSSSSSGSGSSGGGGGGGGRRPRFAADFSGLTRALAAGRLPPASHDGGRPGDGAPGNYTFAHVGTSGFRVMSPGGGCVFEYRLAEGAFPGFEMEPCAAGAPGCPASCPAGYGRVPLKGAAGSLCAPCPAGTFGAGGPAAPCAACPSGTASPRAGAARCERCGGGLAAARGGTACVPCFDSDHAGSTARGGWYTTLDFASLEGFNRFAGYAAAPGAPGCTFVLCPPASLPDPLGNCISSEPGSGRLCVAAAAPSAPAPRAGDACSEWGMPHKGDAPAQGGAALRLAGASGAGCGGSGVRALVAQLGGGRVTWAGYRYAFGATPLDSGVFWELLGGGDLGGVLGRARECTDSRAGPGAGPELTLTGQPLGTRAAAFGLLLHDESAAHKGHRERQAPPRGYGAVFAPGPAPGTLEATLFEDTGVGACGLTSLSPPPRPGSCKLVFKVEAGSFLGVSGPPAAPCPKGTVKAGGGSCAACAPGYAAVGGACKECGGRSFSPAGVWGATACRPCASEAPGLGPRLSCDP